MQDFTLLDILSFAFFILVTFGYGYVTHWTKFRENNISAAIHNQRREWMHVMSMRENRVIDTTIMTSLSQGNAFFASTAIIIIGVIVSVLGGDNQLHKLIDKIPFAVTTSAYVFNLKLIFILIIFVITFFKFAWAYRLTNYTSIMIGATPLPTPDDPERQKQTCKYAERVADLSGLAGHHSNVGLRSYYYGIAASGWLINPIIFLIATAMVVAVLYRREYKSRALNTIIRQE